MGTNYFKTEGIPIPSDKPNDFNKLKRYDEDKIVYDSSYIFKFKNPSIHDIIDKLNKLSVEVTSLQMTLTSVVNDEMKEDREVIDKIWENLDKIHKFENDTWEFTGDMNDYINTMWDFISDMWKRMKDCCRILGIPYVDEDDKFNSIEGLTGYDSIHQEAIDKKSWDGKGVVQEGISAYTCHLK